MDAAELSELMGHFEVAEMRPDKRAPNMLVAAEWYATTLRWPIFPIHHPVADAESPHGWRCSCGRDDERLAMPQRCKSPGKHPMTSAGFKDASTDLSVVRAWWQRAPLANIGVPTGLAGCGLDVIDIDGPEGLETWQAWRERDADSIPALAALAFTPGNRKRKAGRHWFTAASGTANTARALPGIDLRGDGGYVLVPPSQGITGPRYTWIRQPEVPR